MKRINNYIERHNDLTVLGILIALSLMPFLIYKHIIHSRKKQDHENV